MNWANLIRQTCIGRKIVVPFNTGHDHGNRAMNKTSGPHPKVNFQTSRQRTMPNAFSKKFTEVRKSCC